MNGRDILLTAVRNGNTPRPAWLPFVGVHGARLLGLPASDYLQSADRIVEGLRRARELYQPDGLPVLFDLQIEAEALGCRLKWADETPPAVVHHPLEDGVRLDELPVFDPAMGRFPVALEALDRAKADMGSEVALYGLVCGPFTLALHLMGNNIFLQMFDHPDYVKAVIGFCASVSRKAAAAYLAHGADVVGVVDPMTSQIAPDALHRVRHARGQPGLRRDPRPRRPLLALRVRRRHAEPRRHVRARTATTYRSTRTSPSNACATSPAAVRNPSAATSS